MQELIIQFESAQVCKVLKLNYKVLKAEVYVKSLTFETHRFLVPSSTLA